MLEPLWRRRFHIQWPTLPAPQSSTVPPWSWHFDADYTGEFGHWYISSADGERHLADPTLPAAYRTSFVAHDTFAVIGLATANEFTIYYVEPGVPSRRLYHHAERAEIGSLSCDGTLVCIQHTEHSDWYHPALRVLNMRGQTIANLSDGPQRGLWPGAWSPLRNDQRLLIHHQRADALHPAIWSPITGELRTIPITLSGDVHATWYPDAQSLLLNHELYGRNTLFRFDLHDDALTSIPTDVGTIWRTTIMPDGEILYLWDSSGAPPETCSTVRGRISTAHDPTVGGRTYQNLHIAGIHSFFVEPQTPRPHPTVFMARCNNIEHNRDAFSPLIQSWVDHGFAVVLVNYRGTMGYGRSWRDAVLGKPGLTEVADIATVADWVVANHIADPERMLLFGESWGRYLALLGLGVQPDRWALGVALAPVGDVVACYEDTMPTLQALNRAQFGGTPTDVPQTYTRASPITYVEHVRAPVMLVVGEHDARCPRRQNERYVTRLQDLGKVHQVHRFTSGHGIWGAAMLPYIETALVYAAQHLGTQPPQG
jgi:dienelactone hydrolase